MQWLCNYSHPKLANYGKELNKYTTNSNGFIKLWQQLGDIDPGNFEKLQDEFALNQYYYPVLQRLKVKYFNVDKHSFAMQSVIFARAIQNGNSGCISLIEYVNEKIFEYPNLSYIDNIYFDNDIITEIYNFLISECDSVYWDYRLGYYRSTYNFCHAYNLSVINGLRNRFVNEKIDALWMLKQYN